ncbi:MAG: mercuric transporter [Porticoccaceae bacterium]|nr:MAG: mercuric transporter [Porticoccaceae bacterium]
MPKPKPETGALAAGGLAAILASSCCLGPLALVTLGLSGAWIGRLTALEPFRPLFLTASLAALGFAWHRLYRRGAPCRPDELCARPRVRAAYGAVFWLVAALVLVAFGFPYALPLFY